MTLAPVLPPNAKVIGEPGTVGRALACGTSYLITCFSHSGWIASNNFHFKRHSGVSNPLISGGRYRQRFFGCFGARPGHTVTAPLTAREGCAGREVAGGRLILYVRTLPSRRLRSQPEHRPQ